MFTGIILHQGHVAQSADFGEGKTLRIAAPSLGPLEVGESVACNGVCLTVTNWENGHFSVDLSAETLAKTADRWHEGTPIHLERAMRMGDRFGGHVVSGHVDGVGSILEAEHGTDSSVFILRAPAQLAPFLMPKGSITADGVSLTIVDSGGPAGSRPDWPEDVFSLWIIPHTLQQTQLSAWVVGSPVNLEADQNAKYLERLLEFRLARQGEKQ